MRTYYCQLEEDENGLLPCWEIDAEDAMIAAKIFIERLKKEESFELYDLIASEGYMEVHVRAGDEQFQFNVKSVYEFTVVE